MLEKYVGSLSTYYAAVRLKLRNSGERNTPFTRSSKHQAGLMDPRPLA